MLQGEFFQNPGGGGAFYDHQINQSLFIAGGGTHGLNRTLGTPTNEYKLTLSCWIKRSEIGDTNIQEIYKAFTGSQGVNTGFDYVTDDKLSVAVSPSYDGSTTASTLDPVFRDITAFMHLVIAYDTTDGTSTNRVKVYQNGTQLTGYTTEVVIIDGQQLAPTSFAEEKNGVWIPKDPSSLTFGNNGAYLKFASGAIGTDSSGNGNNFSTNGTLRVVLDSPTFGE